MKKELTYPTKIIVAWGEAITGNRKIRDWLIKNGYKELGLFAYALRNKEEARKWLIDNGYPHLMALINGAEGNGKAINWLEQHQFKTLSKMALAGDGDTKARKWLEKNHKLFAIIARKIEYVKDQIEYDNNDVHKISRE